ncbi:RNA polymerase I enhancer binding protein [Mortierella alpina]|nr:RNA polymerase I enhancer binding protein [Mortierella alpina]
MEYQSAVPTNKRKNSQEALGAVFKKALVSSTNNFGHDQADYSAATGNVDLSDTAAASGSAEHSARQQDPEGDKQLQQQHHHQQLASSHGFSSLSSSSAVDAASATILSTMAGILAGAGGDQSDHRPDFRHSEHKPHDHSQTHSPDLQGVGEDVLRMQQQLQQQVPLDPSTNTRMTREQIMESMTSIPTMQMILEESLKGDMAANRAGHRDTDQNSQQQQNPSVDHSILATLNSTVSHPSSPQSPVEIDRNGAHGSKQSSNGNNKKKAKPSRIQVAHGSDAGTVDSTNDNVQSSGTASASTLEDHFKRDIAVVTSDNPLHTKWLMATALKDKGISYKTGTFSSHEDELIRQTIKDYVARHSMPEDAIQRWFQNGNGRGRFEKNDLKALWVEIAVRLQNRPLLNIYLHVRRMFHPQNNVGTWSKEDDEKLIMLYAKHKGQWTTIGTELGRMADSCRDRYRNHLKDQSTMVTGPWQPHEDEKLLTIMQDLALQQGKTNILDSSPMWTLISERMQGTRTRHQCRHRYSQTLQPRLERGEWTAPSSAAAAAAAAVAANAAMAANASSAAAAVASKNQNQHLGSQQSQQQQQQHRPQQQHQLHDNLGFDLGSNSDHSKSKQSQEVLMLAAALQGVLPEHGNDNMLWTQAMTTNIQTSDHALHDNGEHHFSNDGHHHGAGAHDPYTAAAIAAAASLPLPTIVPKAPKGPIRRRCGLQQQLDSLKMIQEEGYTDHTDIKWSDIAQRLRDKVEEGNAIQLARIIQTYDQLDSKKQQHLQDGDSTAAAAAAASAAMAAAVSAAQAEAVASLQRVPAANQIARTFMSSRCKIDGYREMTLQTVIVFMMQDVERRIQHRRGGSANSPSPMLSSSQNGNNESGEGATSASKTSARRNAVTTGALIQQQVINDAAQQAAIAALSAQFPFLQQYQQHQHQSALAHALSDPASDHQHQQHQQPHQTSQAQASGVGGVSHVTDMPDQPSTFGSHSGPGSHQTLQHLSAEEQQHELEQQQHNRDLAEQMLSVAFSTSDLNGFFSGAFSAYSPFSTSSSNLSTLGDSSSTEARFQEHGQEHEQQATRRVLNALNSGEFGTDTSDEEDEDMPEGDGV